jgi:hypothetical protein
MENFELLKSTADIMLADMIKGQHDLTSLNFNIDFFGKGYKVYYERKPIDGKQVWKLVDYKQIGA